MLRSCANAPSSPTDAIAHEGVRQVRSAPSSRRVRTTVFDPPASTQNVAAVGVGLGVAVVTAASDRSPTHCTAIHRAPTVARLF
jgi:hypothetical protein